MVGSIEPLVSVVVPCFNHGAYVSSCIQSILDQTYQNIELIVIDDGSDDDSVEMIERLRYRCEQRFVRFAFRARTNQGVCTTLNEALAWCRGDFLCPVASDDVMLPHKTCDQVRLFLQQPVSVVGVFGGEIVVDTFGQTLRQRPYPPCWYQFEDVFLRYAFLSAPTAMLRLDAVKAVGGYPNGVFVEDWYMWLRLLENGGVFYNSGELLVKKRVHSHNASHQLDAIWESSIQILARYQTHPKYSQALARVMVAQSFYYMKIDLHQALNWLWRAFKKDARILVDWRLFKTAYLRFFK